MKQLISSIAIFVLAIMPMNAKNVKGVVEVNNKAVSTTRIYNYLNSNNEFVKYEYALDEAGRVIAKTGYKWNRVSNTWSPTTIYTAEYGTEQNTLKFALWNSSKHSFSTNVQEQDFGTDMNVLIALPKE